MNSPQKTITSTSLRKMKEAGEKITVCTCYDYSFAVLLAEAGIEVLLVGDSAANVIAGHPTTLPITLDQMIYHAASVVRGAPKSLVVVDLPFGSYQEGPSQALSAAVRVLKESGAQAVKLEGGRSQVESIKKLTTSGIPVMGHLGLTPQSVHRFGGYALQANSKEAAKLLIEEARLLEDAACFALVLEKVPATLAAEVEDSLSIPVIGIGAGAAVSGQVLVLHDALGINEGAKPRFVKEYAALGAEVRKAMSAYCQEVKQGLFPEKKHSY